MYTTGPSHGSDGGAGLAISRVERRRFAAPSELALDKTQLGRMQTYLSDSLRPYGLRLRPGAIEEGRGHAYAEMAEAVISATVPPDQPVELLVLAFAIHDISPGRATATYLSDVCPGKPLAFAICDQGPAAAFTGLRMIRQYARDSGWRALLLIVEQADLPYDPGMAVEIPAAHTAVALLCGEPTAGRPAARSARVVDVRQHTDVPPEEVDALLCAEVAALSSGRSDVTLVVDEDLTARSRVTAQVDRLRVVPAGQPTTGVWWELAGALSEAEPGPGLAVLACYDPQLRYLCLSAIDVS